MGKGDTIYNDPELIREIECGNTAAFDQLYRQFYPALHLLSYKLTKSAASAEDIVSEVFLQLWEKRAALRSIQDLKAYLYVLTKNRTFNYLKSTSYRAVSELNEGTFKAGEPAGDDFFETLLHVETIRVLREAVHTLPSECKKVIELVLKGHSTNDISRMLGISPSAISHQKARAIRLLKDKIFLAVFLALQAAVSSL